MKKNWIEYIVLAISSVIVLGIGAFLAFDNLQTNKLAPDIEILLGEAIPQAQGFLVPVTALNRGDETAQAVQIEVELTGTEPAKSNFDIDYIPRRSKREGWVRFDVDPAIGTLRARVLGFSKP